MRVLGRTECAFDRRISRIGRSHSTVCALAATRRQRSGQFARSVGASSAPNHPSPKEFAHGDKQANERKYDEYDLMDMILARRQAAQKVRQPEDGIVP